MKIKKLEAKSAIVSTIIPFLFIFCEYYGYINFYLQSQIKVRYYEKCITVYFQYLKNFLIKKI